MCTRVEYTQHVVIATIRLSLKFYTVYSVWFTSVPFIKTLLTTISFSKDKSPYLVSNILYVATELAKQSSSTVQQRRCHSVQEEERLVEHSTLMERVP